MQCAFCMNTKDMHTIPVNIDDKYCGNIFVCGGCYRHIMGRPENKQFSSDSGEGNLVTWGYTMIVYCNYFNKEVDNKKECSSCSVETEVFCPHIEEIIKSDNGED